MQTLSSPASGKSNEVRMEDGAGGMEFFLNASKDYDGRDAATTRRRRSPSTSKSHGRRRFRRHGGGERDDHDRGERDVHDRGGA